MAKPISEWFTKAQASAALRISERTVDRLCERGQLKRQDRGNVPVFDPDDVDRLAKQKGLSDPVGQSSALVPANQLPGIMQAMAEAIRQDEGQDEGLPLSELRYKTYLTTPEAVRYSGLTADYLSDLVGQGKLKRLESMRPFRYRRQDLDQL